MKLRAAQGREKRLSAENELLRGDGDSRMLICQSPAMAQVLSLARRVAASPMPILITGENGTGKSLLAAYMHRHSPFAQGPFISVNMGAIAESTFESETFGHTRGAFTDVGRPAAAGSRSPARWWVSRRCCWPTSPRATLIQRTRSGSWTCSPRCTSKAAPS